MPLTGFTASGDYDDVPSLSNIRLSVVPGSKTLKELCKRCSVNSLVVMASGGDYTASGDFQPVQMSYLTDSERILDLPLSSIFQGTCMIFSGDDFIGMSCDKPFGEKGLWL